MRMTNIISHRNYANRKLRKEAEAIKTELYAHKEKYETECRKIDETIKKSEENYKQTLKEKNKVFEEIIADSYYHYSCLVESIEEYVSLYYERQLIIEINQKRHLLVSQYREYTDVLKEKELLLKEIEKVYLDRKTILAGKADVTDIIQTIMMSNYSGYFSPSMNARSLLIALRKLHLLPDDFLGSSVNRLQRLVEERASYLEEIDYIIWMKGQIEFELSAIKSQIKQNKEKVLKLRGEMTNSKNRKEAMDGELQIMWNNIALEYGKEYESEIEQAIKERDELRGKEKQKKNEAYQKVEDIDNCYRWHSYDNLDKLKEEKDSLFEEANALSCEADEYEKKRVNLVQEKKKAYKDLVSFLREHGIKIISQRV